MQLCWCKITNRLQPLKGVLQLMLTTISAIADETPARNKVRSNVMLRKTDLLIFMFVSISKMFNYYSRLEAYGPITVPVKPPATAVDVKPASMLSVRICQLSPPSRE